MSKIIKEFNCFCNVNIITNKNKTFKPGIGRLDAHYNCFKCGFKIIDSDDLLLFYKEYEIVGSDKEEGFFNNKIHIKRSYLIEILSSNNISKLLDKIDTYLMFV